MNQNQPPALLTEGALNEIEKRAASATPGPWRWAHDTTNKHVVLDGGFLTSARDEAVSDSQEWANGDMIAAARTDVPALIATVRHYRALVCEASDVIDLRRAEVERLTARAEAAEARADTLAITSLYKAAMEVQAERAALRAALQGLLDYASFDVGAHSFGQYGPDEATKKAIAAAYAALSPAPHPTNG